MAELIYSMITSLDGYVADEDGGFDWAEPDAEMHAYINEVERSFGTYLYGRRMYETMAVWETDKTLADQSPQMAEYTEIWLAADKIVYSTSLPAAVTARTKVERSFDAEVVRQLKADADRNLSIAGPTLAAHALKAGLVDEVQAFIMPVVVGGGQPFLPPGLRLDLDLAEERRFAGGAVHLRYRVR